MKAEERINRFSSGRTFQRDNRKVRPFVQIGNLQVQFQLWVTDVELGRIMRSSGIKFERRFSFDALMWSEFVVPSKVKTELTAHVGLPQRDDDLARAFGFHGADKAFDNGNGAIFSNRAVARFDFSAFAPCFEALTPKLGAFIGDDVFGMPANRMDSATEKGTDLEGIWLVVEDGEADDLS